MRIKSIPSQREKRWQGTKPMPQRQVPGLAGFEGAFGGAEGGGYSWGPRPDQMGVSRLQQVTAPLSPGHSSRARRTSQGVTRASTPTSRAPSRGPYLVGGSDPAPVTGSGQGFLSPPGAPHQRLPPLRPQAVSSLAPPQLRPLRGAGPVEPKPHLQFQRLVGKPPVSPAPYRRREESNELNSPGLNLLISENPLGREGNETIAERGSA